MNWFSAPWDRATGSSNGRAEDIVAAISIRKLFGMRSDPNDRALGALAYMPGGIFDLVLASIFINVLGLALPLTLLQVYDRIIPADAAGTLSLLVIGVGIALVLEALLRLGRSYVSGWMGARFEHLAGCNAMEKLLRSPVVDYEREGAGVHLERMTSLNVLKEFYAGQAVLAVCDLPFAILYLGAVWYLAGHLVVVPLILIVAFFLVAGFVGRKLKDSLESRMLADDRRYNFIIEVLGGIHTIKGLAMEEQMLRRYERLQETCATSERSVSLNSSAAQSTGAVFSQVTMFAVVGYGATFVIDGVLTIGGLAACTMLSGRAMQPLQRAVGIWTRFQSIALARDRLRKLMAMEFEADDDLPDMGPIKGDLELRNVSYFYGKNRDGEDLPWIFQNISLRVKPGEAVGIRGSNASGKTTLLLMMNGVIHPTSGDVLVDGSPISRFNPTSVRHTIALLPQNATMFNGTILENLTMFRREKEPEAMDMARLLGLDHVVAHMPMGYDTMVGDGAGENLPRGIKQRVAIARAMVDKPRILLFDEANTAMDSKGDAMLKDLLERLKGRVTLVLVSSRPSLLSIADRVYQIEDTKLIELPPQASGPNVPPAAQPNPQQPGIQPEAGPAGAQ
ncbi:MAG: ABC transporter transmembrane domain-containing protein [Rhodospirillales bacterium]